MSNPNASIVAKTYLALKLNEVDAVGGSVPVTLYIGNAKPGSPGLFYGAMKYQTNNLEASIDLIEVHYSNNRSANLNNVTLQVTLGDSGNYFTEPNPVRDRANQTPPDVVLQELSGGTPGQPNIVTLTYQIPANKNSVVMSELYFHTKLGIIDPDEEIERDPY